MIILFDNKEQDILKECIERMDSFISFVSGLEKVYNHVVSKIHYKDSF